MRYSEITPYIKELAGISNGNNHIKPEMYSEHDVKRGLRDLDGNGVVTGLTEISHIKAKEMGPNGESIPCEGELYFRGYNVRNLVSGFLNKDRFGFEEIIYLLLFSELPTQKQLDKFKEDNKKGVTYNGKHYTSYEATQKQRQIERATRRQKRRVLVAESSGDKDRLLTSQIKLRRLNEEYRRYSKAVNLPTQQERLQIAGFGKKQAAQATGAANKYYNEWSKSIGLKDSVKTLDKYYDIKYTTPPRYELLKQYAKDVESGWISPLSGFDNYENLYNRIQTEIVSKEAANGTIIQGQVPHFMQRVIGTMVDPEKLKKDLRIIRRSGVNIDDISDALFNPEKIGPVLIRSTGQKSVKFIGKNCAVSINPDTGYLIQTNPI